MEDKANGVDTRQSELDEGQTTNDQQDIQIQNNQIIIKSQRVEQAEWLKKVEKGATEEKSRYKKPNRLKYDEYGDLPRSPEDAPILRNNSSQDLHIQVLA